MAFILFLFGLLLILLFNFKIKKILISSFLITFLLLNLISSYDKEFKTHILNQYSSFYGNVTNTLFSLHGLSFKSLFTPKPQSTDIWSRGKRSDIELFYGGERTDNSEKSFGVKTDFYKAEKESFYKKLFKATLYTWGQNKILGNGIKSFYVDCHNLASPKINIDEDEFTDKINVSCSNHPHNYYFQILTTTGIIGIIIIIFINLKFYVFAFKNYNFLKKNSMINIILLSAVIGFFLEMFPIRSTGSLYTTNNATFIILIGSIILSYKNLVKKIK